MLSKNSSLFMQNLKTFSFIPLILTLFGCASPQYRIHQQLGERTGIIISSDRVIVECEDQFAGGGDFKDRFAFFVHFLDEEKTVVSSFQAAQTSGAECFEKLRATEKILKSSKKVYIAGIGALNEPRVVNQYQFHFPKFGDFHGNGRSMYLGVIKGEDGSCVTAFEGMGNPCPWDPIFPAETVPFTH